MFLFKFFCGLNEIFLRFFYFFIVGRYYNLNFIQYGICITWDFGEKMFIKGSNEIFREKVECDFMDWLLRFDLGF